MFEVADGVGVLCGPGLFVNQAVRVGLDGEIDGSVLDEFERRCRRVGVPPVVEVTEVSDPSLEDLLRSRGYASGDRTSVLVRRLDSKPPPTGREAATFTIEAVEPATLTEWEETAAHALGITDATTRAASDTFARAAFEVDDPGLLLVRRTADGRALGCATLELGDGLATLGGMSTVPSARRQGVQTELVEYRLALAHARGCDMAASSTAEGSNSERNLVRLGFEPLHTKVAWQKQAKGV